MPGPAPKPDGQRQRRNSRAIVPIESAGLPAVVPAVIPDPPRGLLKRTRVEWVAFWSSDVARVIERTSDLATVERLFTLRDERARAYEGYRKERLVEGSQGQSVLSPFAGMMQKCDAEVRALEDRLGMNPKSRLQLGIKFMGARKALNEFTDELEPQWTD